MAAFNIRHPGVKEFAIVIGGTLVLYLGYEWWKNRQSSSSSDDSADTGTTQAASPTGLSSGALLAWLQNHNSSASTTSTSTGTSSTGTSTTPSGGTTTTTSTSSGPKPISRVNRSKPVRRKEHQIYEIHKKSEKPKKKAS
jgi:cytoskeletal protein RodZ